MNIPIPVLSCILIALIELVVGEDVSTTAASNFRVEGDVIFPASSKGERWASNSRVLLNHGQHIGFVKEDGSFVVDNVPSGSYVVQIENVDFLFEPIRVDITGKGKMRARKLSILQPNAVSQLPYPLKLTAREPTRYFRKREEWRITDMLLSPMVLMLLLPFLVMVIIPKLTANDPQLQKEMEQMSLPKMDMPDVSEMMANYFGGGPKKTASNKKMGFFSSLSQLLGLGKKQVNVVVIGLDNSGKTTILNHLKTPDTRVAQIVPTVGYAMTNFATENFSFNAFDMAGAGKYRNLWESYYASAQAIVFVVDSADRLRMSVARDELWMLLDHKDISSKSGSTLFEAITGQSFRLVRLMGKD
ncbi:hypothetical protein WR25_02142 [Diploscapter pachys]|uniref:ER membrane protein complex subunit 7 beta-sandwich domain-containing protein n=1 Tax=Diploscapter pachys TaxID=2018661 RepID=A0A2A2K4X1_9BILA|nr:hypothetical protein WR25_02142 [Diploscapter pachys]